jgi:hypothetical protein
MAEYVAIKSRLEKKKILFYAFHHKSVKPITAIIRYLPGNTAAEDIANEILAWRMKVIVLDR